MAVTLVNSTAGTATVSGGTISVSPPSGLTTDDLWVIALDVDTNAAGTEVINLPSGWTSIVGTLIVDPGVDNYPAFRAFYKKAGSSESAVSISFSSGTFFDAAYINCRVSGQHLTTPIDGTPVSATPSGDQSDYNAPDATVAAADSLGMTFLFAQNSSVTAVPSGTTTLGSQTGQFPTIAGAYQAQNAGTWSPGAWNNSADKIGALSFIIAPAGGAAGTPPSSRLSLLGVG